MKASPILSSRELALSLLPKRTSNSHKGNYGKALMYVGSADMPGAARLASLGALRTGAGLVCVASHTKCIDICAASLCEPIYIRLPDGDKGTDAFIEYSGSCTCALVGCGIGKGEEVTKRVNRIIRELDIPIILDADGINAISGNINVLSEAKNEILLLPHPLEFSRISGISVEYIQKNRQVCADDFAKAHGVTLLLKGNGTVIADKNGRCCINTTGGSALSKGGSGDVLAGIICSLACQGLSLFDAAVCGAYFHGAAGDSLAVELSDYGVLPSEIPLCVAKLISEYTK